MNSSTDTLKGRPLILIDWGNTLMRDAPNAPGPMCDWPVVEAMPDAAEALRYMAAHFPVVLATGASCSNREQIMQALKRAGLDEWISAVFLAAEIGSSKSSPQFYTRIANELEVRPEQLVMIGNDLVNDVQSARHAGLHAYWTPEDGDEGSELRFTLLEAARAAMRVLQKTESL
jgi:putative hydrolase of the HAD superfamily